MNSQTLFECNDLSVGYGRPLTSEINLSISSREILFIKGKNGSGKSTFIKTILGKNKALAGNYKWHLNSESISYLPQITNPTSHFSFTINEILDLYNISRTFRDKLPKGLEGKKWIDASGGEKQKVMLLTRLSDETKVLILDEPFNHLDQESIDSFVDLLVNIVSENKLSIILVSHLEIELPNELQKTVELK